MATVESKLNYSRAKARKKFKRYFPNFNLTGVHIHHLDGNPMNNDINNLVPVYKPAHMRLHHKGPKSDKSLTICKDLQKTTYDKHLERLIESKDTQKLVDTLNSLLTIYNDF
jgi:hypothetical protein